MGSKKWNKLLRTNAKRFVKRWQTHRNRPKPGRLITIEGIDGCGKSTLMTRLETELKSQGHDVRVVRMLPEGRIRDLVIWDESFTPEQRMLLLKVEGDRARAMIDDHRSTPCIVLCERAADSFFAYQGFGESLLEEVVKLNVLFDPFPIPDATVFLDLPVKDIDARLKARAAAVDVFETKSLLYFTRVREGFMHAVSVNPSAVTIDATLPEDEVFYKALALILPVLPSLP